MNDVVLESRDPALLTPIIGDERSAALQSIARHMRAFFGAGRVVNVTETPPAGALGEMVRGILGYCAGAGLTVQWKSMRTTEPFATIIRRLRDLLYGLPGDDGPLGEAEHHIYAETIRQNFAAMSDDITKQDVFFLHDPGTAGLIPLIRRAGGRVIWRCHAGADSQTVFTARAWAFLEPFVREANRLVAYRSTFIPPLPPPCRITVVNPGIDPCATRNLALTPQEARGTLTRAGILDGDRDASGTYRSSIDGVRPLPRLDLLGDSRIPADARLLVQIGGWDQRSDMAGVLRGFADHTAMSDDVHLLLCGAHDPIADAAETRAVLDRCVEIRDALPNGKRSRVHLITLPADDADVTGHIVNALQTAADVVTQKSRTEGFSLTVAEAMWKRRPVVASGIGGIRELIADERDGLLLGNPDDIARFGQLLSRVLADPDLARSLGDAAHTRIARAFMPDRHLLEYANLVREIEGGRVSDDVASESTSA